MKIKVFKEDDAVQHVEFELQEDSQSDPTEYFPEFFHFQGPVVLLKMNNSLLLNKINRFFLLIIYKIGICSGAFY